MVLLGSTGSIGVNALAIAARFGIEVEALVAGKNIALLNEQIKQFHPKYVCVSDEADVSSVLHVKVFGALMVYFFVFVHALIGSFDECINIAYLFGRDNPADACATVDGDPAKHPRRRNVETPRRRRRALDGDHAAAICDL